MIELSLIQKIIIRIRGHVSIGPKIKEGWTAPLTYYAIKCPEHGIVVDYPHGRRQYLTCPKCQESEEAR